LFLTAKASSSAMSIYNPFGMLDRDRKAPEQLLNQ
jgi:hypothetical protein